MGTRGFEEGKMKLKQLIRILETKVWRLLEGVKPGGCQWPELFRVERKQASAVLVTEPRHIRENKSVFNSS